MERDNRGERSMTKAICAIAGLAMTVLFTCAAVSAQGGTATAKKEAPADQNKTKAQEAPAQPFNYEKMTKEEITADIKESLIGKDEIINMIPGMTKEKDEAGNTVYKYNGTKLEGLDKEALWKLFGRVRNEVTRINTERLNRQLAQIRQIEAANRAAQQARQLKTYAPSGRQTAVPTIPKQRQGR